MHSTFAFFVMEVFQGIDLPDPIKYTYTYTYILLLYTLDQWHKATPTMLTQNQLLHLQSIYLKHGTHAS